MENVSKKHVFYLFTALLPLIIAGCGGGGKQSSAEKPKEFKISHLQPEECDFEQTQNDVTVRAKLLQTKQECVDIFGKNGKRLLRTKKNKIYPIKFSFTNNSKKLWTLAPENIEVKPASANEVRKKINNKFGENLLLGLGILGASAAIGCLAATGLVLAAPLFMNITCPCCFIPLILGPPAITTSAGAIIAPTTMYIKTKKGNEVLSKKIEQPTMKNNLSIQEKQTAIMFVHQRDYKKSFSLSLTNNENQNKLTFNVQLPEIKVEQSKKRKKIK